MHTTKTFAARRMLLSVFNPAIRQPIPAISVSFAHQNHTLLCRDVVGNRLANDKKNGPHSWGTVMEHLRVIMLCTIYIIYILYLSMNGKACYIGGLVSVLWKFKDWSPASSERIFRCPGKESLNFTSLQVHLLHQANQAIFRNAETVHTLAIPWPKQISN